MPRLFTVAVLSLMLVLAGCSSGGFPAAIRNNDVNQVKALIEKGENIDEGEVPPLVMAAQTGNREIVRLLLARGAKVDIKSKEGDTPLRWATLKCHGEVSRLLVQAGADVNEVSPSGSCLLITAAIGGDAEIVKMLLEKGARVDCENKQGQTPLLCAVVKKKSAVAKMLLQAGADIRHRTKNGDTILTEAAAAGDKEIVGLLLAKGAAVDVLSAGRTPLAWAAQRGHAEVVRLLLQAGADVNLRGEKGITPLIGAVFSRNMEIAEMLTGAGARVNDVTDAGENALMYAAAQSNAGFAMVRLLVEKGTDLNSRTTRGLTAFALACQRGNADVAVFLYEKGAAANVPDTTEDWVEISGRANHFLGDYYLAKDDFQAALACYKKAEDYYSRTASHFNGLSAKTALKQAGAHLALAMLGQYHHDGSSYQGRDSGAGDPARAAHSRTGIQGYADYMARYGQGHAPTYNSLNLAYLLPPAQGGMNGRRQYEEMKGQQFDNAAALMAKVQTCFAKDQKPQERHACVATAVREARELAAAPAPASN